MTILAVDDEKIALEALTEAIRHAEPEAEIIAFRNGLEALAYCDKNQVDIAFLDISMREITGVKLAEYIKEKQPKINIIFSTGYDEYRTEAFDMHASGYITKPITDKKVRKELDDLRHPVEDGKAASRPKKVLRIKGFGNFDVFDEDGRSLHFDRQKAKEMFAYLVLKRGTSCTVREIAAVLFEDGDYDKKQQLYIQKIISSMMNTLRAAGAETIVNKTYNSIGLNADTLDCDFYRAMDTKDYSGYLGEFFAQYSWAEDYNYFFGEL